MENEVQFKVLHFINELRNFNGLRQQDFKRYRKHCTQRRSKLCRALKVKQDLKFDDICGFDHNTLTEGIVSSDRRYLDLVLLEAERAWAAAFEAKHDPNREDRKKYSVFGRLRRACIFAATLDRACSWAILDDISKLEIKVYIWILNGHQTFEREQWKASRQFFSASSEVLTRLAQRASVPVEDKALYLAFNDELEPSLRFCEYNLINPSEAGDPVDLLATVAKELGSIAAPTKMAGLPSSLIWFGNAIQLPSSEVCRLAFDAQQAECALFSDHIADTAMLQFDHLVGAYAEMALAANKLLDEHQVTATKILSSRSAEIITNLHQLQACAEQRYRTSFILRHWCLAKETFSISRATPIPQLICTGRVEEVAQLMEKVLQALEEIARIPIFNEDHRFEQWVLSNVSFFKAFRMVYIGQQYANHHELAKALVLFERAHQLFTQAKAFKTQAVQSNAIVDSIIQLDELEQWVAISLSQAQQAHARHAIDYAQAYSDVLEGASSLGFHGPPEPVSLNLKRFPRFKVVPPTGPLSSPLQPPLFGLEPQLRPMPCKPIAFDVAYKEFAQGGAIRQAMVARLAERAGLKASELAEPTPSTGGFGSLLSSIFGR